MTQFVALLCVIST